MIHATFRRESNLVTSFTIKGHANYAKYGQDIVCAAVSSISLATVNSLAKYTYLEVSELSGYLSVELSIPDEVDKFKAVEVLLDLLYTHLINLASIYPENIVVD